MIRSELPAGQRRSARVTAMPASEHRCYAALVSPRPLGELLGELSSALRTGTLSEADRVALERVHADLDAALHTRRQPSAAAPHGLRDELRSTIERLEREHPRLTAILGRLLDRLSELGL